MSSIAQIIEERAVELGGFHVGRLLPFRGRRMVGPFVFIDHMGPASLAPGTGFDVPPHPHIGLSTLTWLLEGAVRHRDSLGSDAVIEPGAVNWMTAGRGITHSERSPFEQRAAGGRLHGLQIWVALPVHDELCAPSFTQVAAGDIPSDTLGGASLRLIAGTLRGLRSPVPVHSPLYLPELQARHDTPLDLGDVTFGERAIYILRGTLESEGHSFHAGQLLVAKDGAPCRVTLAAESMVYVFGGDPFPEPRYIDWNFVSSSREHLANARRAWIAREFPAIDGDDDRVPHPAELLPVPPAGTGPSTDTAREPDA